MKCTSCGSNLEIDNAFCPYCGKENPVAKKHREDMAAYSKEYAATKKEVIDNSRKFNKKNFKITVIAATVAAVLATILFCAFCEHLSYEHYRNERIKRTKDYKPEIERYVKEADFFALAGLISEENLYISSVDELSEYAGVSGVVSSYRSLYQSLIKAKNGEKVTEYYVSVLARDLFSIRKYAFSKDNYGDVKKFYETAYSDVKCMLKLYLGMDDEDISKIDDMSQGAMEVMFEEVFNE